KLRLSGLFVDTDRDEDETSIEYAGEDLGLDGVAIQRERISQQTYALSGDIVYPLARGELGVGGSWSGDRDDTAVETDEGDTVAEAVLDEREFLDLKDDEYAATLFYTFLGDGVTAKMGMDFLSKTRDGENLIEGEDPEAGAVFEIREKRYDPYFR